MVDADVFNYITFFQFATIGGTYEFRILTPICYVALDGLRTFAVKAAPRNRYVDFATLIELAVSSIKDSFQLLLSVIAIIFTP